VAADEARRTLCLGQDGQLHEVRVVDRAVEQAERRRIDHVLGIVQRDQPERAPAAPLVFLECGIEHVEAVGLGGRAVAFDRHQPQARIAVRAVQGRRGGRRVVAVAADIEAQLGLRPGGQGMGDREPDHPFLVPRGDQDRGRPRQGAFARVAPVDSPALRATGQPQPDPHQVDDEFVERADEKEHCGEQQKLVLDERQPFERHRLPHSVFPPKTTGPG